MKVYYGNNDKDYLVEHTNIDEIKKLVLPKLYAESVKIGNDMKQPSCKN